MTNEITNSDDLIDVRDIIARVEELRTETEDAHDDSDADMVLDMKAELVTLESLLSDLEGKGGDHQYEGAWYPVSLIRNTYFTEAMREMVEDIGDMPQGLTSYMVIDWEATADNLRADYSSVEFDGTTYWYR